MSIREKISHDVSVKVNEKIALSRREKALLAALGLTGLAVPAIASTARDAGTIAGIDPVADSLTSNVAHQKDHVGSEEFARRGLRKRDIGKLLDRTVKTIDAHDSLVDDVNSARRRSTLADIYGTLEASGYGPIGRLDDIMR